MANDTNNDLFLSILAMDSYNQGPDGYETNETNIGGWAVEPIDLPSGSVAAGFHATVYKSGNEIIISYRGTDAPNLLPNGDILNGWVTATGVLGTQARLATEFYNSVKAANPDATLTLTGHSLGGGLAGMVAKLKGEKAVIFDNMPFEAASNTALAQAQLTDQQIDLLCPKQMLVSAQC